MDKAIEVTGVIDKAHYKTSILADGHMLVSDESEAIGGGDTGPAPAAFLAASLASCTAITLRMYADRKGWDLTQAEVQVTVANDNAAQITRIKRVINLSGQLSEPEKSRLLEIANKCPVHQILTHPIEVVSTLAP